MCGESCTSCGPCRSKRIASSKKQTYDFIPMGGIPDPDRFSSFTEIADFVLPEDKLLAWLAISMYQTVIPESVEGYVKCQRLSTPRVGVWLRCNEAIVAFRGTSVNKAQGNRDILDDLSVMESNSCALSIVGIGVVILEDLVMNGTSIIKLCGHSLGGKAAMCLSFMPQVVQVVALNAAAPIMSPINYGRGQMIARHYHIVGDIISTHVTDSAAQSFRILMNTGKDVDWVDPYYHSTNRFWKGQSWSYLTNPNVEQFMLEEFFLRKKQLELLVTSWGATIISKPIYRRVRDLICSQPIPGAEPQMICIKRKQINEDVLMPVLAGMVGAIIGFATLGPAGLIGGGVAMASLVNGDVNGFMELAIPGYTMLSGAVKEEMQNVFLEVLRKGDDPYDAMKDIGKKYFDREKQTFLLDEVAVMTKTVPK